LRGTRQDDILGPLSAKSGGQTSSNDHDSDLEGGRMPAMQDAIQVLGEARVAEIRANADDLLRQVLANRERYMRKAQTAPEAQRQAA